MNRIDGSAITVEKYVTKDIIDKVRMKSKMYLNIPNILIDDVPKELAVGAIAVHPNTKERIAKVLDKILEAAGMKNNFSVKLVLSEKKVEKVFNDDPEFRKFVLVSADGLPCKVLIDLIKNAHTCAECGKKFDFLAEMTDHMKQTQHKEYFQTYGSILPNIGQCPYYVKIIS